MGLLSNKIKQERTKKIVEEYKRKNQMQGKTCRNCAYNTGRGACRKYNKPITSQSDSCGSWQA